MESQDCVVIKDLSQIKNLCRICLTQSKQMINLQNCLEENIENEAARVYDALCRVMSKKVVVNDNYPSFVCPLCLSLLKLSYKLLMQFETSERLLRNYFKQSVLEDNVEKIEDKIETIVMEFTNEDDNTFAPVELIANSGRYDIKDVVIVEEEQAEKEQFDGFLKNLGTEVSAVFVNKGSKESGKKKQPCSVSVIQYIKPEEYVDVNPTDTYMVNKIGGKTKAGKKRELSNDIQCKMCRKQFLSKRYLTRHMKDIHDKSKASGYLCPLCGWLSKTKSGLYHHTVAKHEERKYDCKKCSKKFVSVGHLRQHMLAHSNARIYLCNECGKSFNYANALTYHMRTHTGEKKYECTFCDRSFAMPCSLKRHIRTHTGVRPYKCSYCEKAFRSRGETSCHEMLHTGYRPYHCKYCGKGFTKTHNLKLHILNHSGNHVCEICCKTFIEIDYLKMHMKATHAEDMEEEDPEQLCSA